MPAWEAALTLYPLEVAESWLATEGRSVDDLADRVASGRLVAVTAMPQGDGEPDEAYCLRYVLTVLAEVTDA